jgi:hypothetical protein
MKCLFKNKNKNILKITNKSLRIKHAISEDDHKIEIVKLY